MGLADLMPPEPAVDTTRAGLLTIAAPILGELLRLPPGLKVTGAYLGANHGEIDLVIQGDPMPTHRPGTVPERVSVILHQQVEPEWSPLGADDPEPERTVHVTAHFAHAPDVEWTMKPPEPWRPTPLPHPRGAPE